MDRQARDELTMLLARLADGDRKAFDPLYEALWPLVRRFAGRALGDSPEADDCSQTALMKLFLRASEFDEDKDALSFVFGITAYECRTFRQKARRRREDPHDDTRDAAGPSEGPTPEDAAIARDLEAAARELLGTLRPVDVSTLHAVLEGRHPADVPHATFRKRVERALSRLRTAWSRRHGTD